MGLDRGAATSVPLDGTFVFSHLKKRCSGQSQSSKDVMASGEGVPGVRGLPPSPRVFTVTRGGGVLRFVFVEGVRAAVVGNERGL